VSSMWRLLCTRRSRASPTLASSFGGFSLDDLTKSERLWVLVAIDHLLDDRILSQTAPGRSILMRAREKIGEGEY